MNPTRLTEKKLLMLELVFKCCVIFISIFFLRKLKNDKFSDLPESICYQDFFHFYITKVSIFSKSLIRKKID